MGRLNDLSLKKIIYWLTDRREKPPQYLRIWGFLAIGSLVLFVVSQSPDAGGLLYLALILVILWVVMTLIYLFWVIQRGLRFVKFKKATQKRDQSFEVPLIASDRKLKP